MSADQTVSTEFYPLAACLNPGLNDDMFPSLKARDLSILKEAGWARVGLVSAVVDERQRILMLTHNPSDKSPAGALGPLAETSQLSRDTQNKVEVESTVHTLSRGIQEELGVHDPSTLKLSAKRIGSWIVKSWPVGVQYAEQNALAICPVVHLGKDEREALQDTFTETEEISDIAFMSREDIAAQKLVRPGTHAWLTAIVASGLTETPYAERSTVDLPGPAPLPDGVDIKFAQLSYL